MKIDERMMLKIKAGNWRRLFAYWIDAMICFGPGNFFAAWGNRINDESMVSIGYWLTIVGFLYFIFRDSGGHGRGPGKTLMKINVLSLKTGLRPEILQTVLRNAYWGTELLIIEIFGFKAGIAYLLYLWFVAEVAVLLIKMEGRRLGDLFGGTMVVLTENWLHFTSVEMRKRDEDKFESIEPS